MEAVFDLPDDAFELPKGRKNCESCERPASACLCEQLPQILLSTWTQLIVLMHPLEERQRLATVPVLQRCLENCQVIKSRNFRPGRCPVLDNALSSQLPSPGCTLTGKAVEDDPQSVRKAVAIAESTREEPCSLCRALAKPLLLFPRPGAVDITKWADSVYRESMDGSTEYAVLAAPCPVLNKSTRSELSGSHPIVKQGVQDKQRIGAGAGCTCGELIRPLLLVVDGTWKHADEMMRSSMVYLEGRVTPVFLPRELSVHGPGQVRPEQWGSDKSLKGGKSLGRGLAGGPGDGGLLLKSEPGEGCVSTMEAVARALRVLEGPGRGPVVESVLLKVLSRMVEVQLSHYNSGERGRARNSRNGKRWMVHQQGS